jgi:chemotaxis signal transduction protein
MRPPIDEDVVARFRREFDETFAKPPATRAEQESFLGLGLRGQPYALRMGQIEGVLTERRIVPLPTGVAAFAGLSAHRGSLVPVYDLGMLLDHPAASTLPWVATVRVSEALVGFGFDRFDGHYRVIASEPTPGNGTPSGHLSFVPGLPGRPVIDILSLVKAALRFETNEARKEQ